MGGEREPAGITVSATLEGDNKDMTLAEKMYFVEQTIEYLQENPISKADIKDGVMSNKEVAAYTALKLADQIDREWNGKVDTETELLLDKGARTGIRKMVTAAAKFLVKKVLGTPGTVTVDVIEKMTGTSASQPGEGEIYGRSRLNSIKGELREAAGKGIDIRMEKFPEAKPKLKIIEWINQNEAETIESNTDDLLVVSPLA
ncbi:hypothetical protein [Colwellia sp. PAMC 21821]|uniref:hypothetical protein n=1 Tax=Colwellia sp. PAMC 21821 TaxID=1816219 RepID=UPI0009BE052F|nr:hypothetical protein [Colwellia sp. PAMC 21821]ARD43803.1 hypothetical protein A3Q33_05450 [Colwellia sp. PAMC 21821]